MIVCIGRAFGSGGHEIAKRLADRLKVPFLDKEFVELAAIQSGMSREELEKADERKANFWLHELHYELDEPELRGLPTNDIMYRLESKIILEQAKKGSCVIVGRCADAVLKKAGIKRLSVFVTAPFTQRVHKKQHQLQLSESDASALVRRTDRNRKAYYNYYSGGGKWGEPENYDLYIDTSVLNIDDIAERLERIVRQKGV